MDEPIQTDSVTRDNTHKLDIQIMDQYSIDPAFWYETPPIIRAHFRCLWIDYQKCISDMMEYEEILRDSNFGGTKDLRANW